jgi:hypothetical protein
MKDDPIVASIRKTQEELAAAFGYDVHAIFADLRAREAKLGDRLVRQSDARRPKVMHPNGVSADPPMDVHSVAAPRCP